MFFEVVLWRQVRAPQAQLCAGEALSLFVFQDPLEPLLQIHIVTHGLGVGNWIHHQVMEEIAWPGNEVWGQTDHLRKPRIAHKEVVEASRFHTCA